MAAQVELFDDLEAVAADAAGALDRAVQPSLFDRLDWFRLTLAHCPPTGRLLVARARRDQRAAWLFLMVERGRAQPLGSWYALRQGVVRFGGEDPALVPALARRLATHGLGRLELGPYEDAGAAGALRRGGWLARERAGPAAWRQQVTGGWEHYWRSRPATLRNTVRRRQGNSNPNIHIYSHFDSEAWSAYEDVYRLSWKPPEGSFAFLRALAVQEGAAGTLRLGIARREGRPIAAQFWLVENGVATIHKLAHVEAERARSPGSLLSAAMFRHAIEADRVTMIDFGLGDEAYKADWMDDRRQLFQLDAFNPRTAVGLTGAARAQVGSLVRRLRRR